MQYPVTYTWAELAALPNAADHFSWDDSMIEEDDDSTTLAGYIEAYNDEVGDKLRAYLSNIGYDLTDTGVTIRNEAALLMAHQLFGQIMYEYDAPEEDVHSVERTLYGYTGPTSPTWALFDISGDDSVDYCGTQPSCLTSLLLTNLRPASVRHPGGDVS